MLFHPRIRLKTLATLCRRLAISGESGIDVRKTWQREAEHSRGRARQLFAGVSAAVAAGHSVAEALHATGAYFPRLFLEMVAVGEEAGSLAEVYGRLADHYDQQEKLRRAFLSRITWPMLQLFAAVGVVGLLIWIMGFLASRPGGESIDLLGLGLKGTRGLIVYLVWVASIGAAAWFVIQAIRRGALWARPLQRAVLQIPGVGPSLQTLAIARIAWSLHLTLNTSMDLRRVLPLAMRSTGNDHYIRHTDDIVADIVAGRSLHESLLHTGAFRREFLDAVEVGEESGQLVSTMQRLSRQYEEQSQAALENLAVVAGFAVWAVVAMIIIFFIFRLASFYLGTINDALNM